MTCKMPATLRVKFLAQLNAMGQRISSASCDTLWAYLLLLHHWNETHNLTAVRSLPAMLTRHVIDSLALSPFIEGERGIDVGSGGGLPGIPLAIVQPDRQWTLLDSNRKKVVFLRHVCHELALSQVQVVHARMEDYAPRMRCDVLVTRALGAVDKVVCGTAHLLLPGGKWLFMQSKPASTLQTPLPLGYCFKGVHEYVLPHWGEVEERQGQTLARSRVRCIVSVQLAEKGR